jgi:hypothetical protein
MKKEQLIRAATAMLIVAFVLAVATVANASIGDFMASSNQFGYAGTVSNVTTGAGAWTFPTPRDATLFFTKNVPGYDALGWNNYNQLLSNWFQHPLSNQNPGFFQLSDDTGATVTSASGTWTQNGSLWDFSVTVTGGNAPYPWSRLWQPDAGMAWGGTFTSYSYSLFATGMTTEVDANGWRWNTIDPTRINGSFDATFVSTFDVNKNLITNGDTYVVHLALDSSLWSGDGWSNTYDGAYYGNSSAFGAPIPEPATVIIWALFGGLGIVFVRRYRRRAA